ncbi:MAG: hypothetical protein HZA91_11095 [Verrucomicrobia bacterium]|nr:hypothetical protein [Verrucomicrobiota bacterium]
MPKRRTLLIGGCAAALLLVLAVIAAAAGGGDVERGWRIEDGGKIMTIGRAGVAAHSMANLAAVVELDEQKQVAFEFQATASRGIHRVALRKGSDVKVIRSA